jgi:hypothetical protein
MVVEDEPDIVNILKIRLENSGFALLNKFFYTAPDKVRQADFRSLIPEAAMICMSILPSSRNILCFRPGFFLYFGQLLFVPCANHKRCKYVHQVNLEHYFGFHPIVFFAPYVFRKQPFKD